MIRFNVVDLPSETLRTPDQWCRMKGIVVVDPDGWDRLDFLKSWAKPITQQEFDTRAAQSTVTSER